jgi:Zn-dependent metalloprotease
MALLTAGLALAGPAAGGEVSRGYAVDGRLSFIGAAHGPLAPPPGIAALAGPEGAAGVFLSLYGPAFGLGDPQREARLERVEPADGGGTVTRYRQVNAGVPVFGGDLVVKTDAAGRLVAMGGKLSAQPAVNVAPAVSAEDATATATAALAAVYGQGFVPRVTDPAALSIYDERLFTEGSAAARLVWKLEVAGLPAHPVREVVLVDAQTGAVALHFNRIDARWTGAKVTTLPRSGSLSATVAGLGTANVIVRSADFLADDRWDAGTFVCDTLQPAGCDYPAADRDATFARLFAENTWSYFNENHAYDLDLQVAGGTGLKSLINIGGEAGSDYWLAKAYWDGEQMNYGDGFAAAEDVVAHEMAHGVTEKTAGLLHLYQSGAIDESFSDLWGELVDQAYHDPWGVERDAAGNAWFIGEDLPVGALRSMANPPLFRDPDRMLSAYFYRGPNDNGGVTRNSGVNNKAAYLMAQGGVFNGRTVAPIGTAKVAQLYFRAQSLLWPAADYYDLYQVLRQACAELTPATLTAADCQAVGNALLAVQMNLRPAALSTGAVAACPAGTVYGRKLFADGFAAGTASWTLAAVDGAGSSLPPSWTTVAAGFSDAAAGGDFSALYAGAPDDIANGLTGGEESASLSEPVAVPPGTQTHLSFEHEYLFESGWDSLLYFWDGGVVECSVDGGATWQDLRPRFSGGQTYNGVLASYAGDDNPLRGRAAFVGNSRGGKVFSRYNLSALGGQSVLVRFRVGYDYGADLGWRIDNVDLHTCVAAPTPPVPLAPASGALLFTVEPTLDWTDALLADAYDYEVAADAQMSSVLQSGRVASSAAPLAPLAPNTRYSWRVRSVALNDREGYSAWSAVRSFRTALVTPTPLAFADPAVTDRPTFSWTASAGAASYTWQVCRNLACTQLLTSGTTAATQAQPLVDLTPDATLFWRVRANGANPSAWSEIRSFPTGNPPTVPALLAPAANLLTQDTTPTFTWRPSLPAAGTGDTVAGYEIQIAADALFTAVVEGKSDVPAGAAPTFTAAGLEKGHRYSWRVRSVSTVPEKSGWTLPRALRIAYAAPALLAPLGTPATRTVVFDWEDVTGQPGPASYTIQVSLNAAFTALLVNGAVVPSTATRTLARPTGTAVFWRVRANGACGPGAWSATAGFTLP